MPATTPVRTKRTHRDLTTGRRRSAWVHRAVVGLVSVGAALVVAPVAQASASDTVWDRVAACESNGNWAGNTGNGYYGGLQFSASTWGAFGGRWYAARADQGTKSQQIAIARRVLAVQGPGAWPTCGARAGLTIAGGLAVQVTPEPRTSTGVRPDMFSSLIPLVVDGAFGAKSKRATEILTGGVVDGYLTRNDTKLLQVWVGSYPDGVIGPKTTRALQATVGAFPDGVWGPKTTWAFQEYLNNSLR